MPLKYIIVFLTLFFVQQKVFCQDDSLEDILIVRIEQSNEIFPEVYAVDYAIIENSKLNTMIFSPQERENGVLYAMTGNGGYYAIPVRYYTLECCEFRNIAMGKLSRYYGQIPDSLIRAYDMLDSLVDISWKKLRANEDGYHCEYQDNEKTYKLTIWSASVSMCVCRKYMIQARQKLAKPDAAYLRELKDIRYPPQSLIDKFLYQLDRFFINE